MTNLIRFIENEENTKLVDLDLSNMNLQSRVEKLTWPIANSKTIQSMHLSNNEIPKNVLTDLLMVFGIRKDESQNEIVSFTTTKRTQAYLARDEDMSPQKPGERPKFRRQISLID